ncbi:hypothetical protein [Flavobacterium selenitireducens]|uniref:hypothetical protein n=1 Tax=Flavobacterium selenitireducens TaxID=2722704 RepID=UPI00168B6184|nr:hypothetical protein [Flavobacterium selenitireducens]MBD3581445.1 hypothetical protein [Flavobacterium selenitireducens]
MAALTSFSLIVPLLLQLYFGRAGLSAKKFALLVLATTFLQFALIVAAASIAASESAAQGLKCGMPSARVAFLGLHWVADVDRGHCAGGRDFLAQVAFRTRFALGMEAASFCLKTRRF